LEFLVYVSFMRFQKLTALFACMIILMLQPLAAKADEVIVAVATNFLLPAREISAQFEADSGHEVTLVAGATGKLATQILGGAPFDVFLAADRERPQLLVDKKAAVAASSFTYATGSLVLWSREALPLSGKEFETLDEARIRRIAMANPRLAPYGKAAEQALDQMGMLTRLSGRIVSGENIGQTFAMAASGNVTAGFIARSQLVGLADNEKGSWVEVPASFHDPIRQDAVVTMRGNTNKAAYAFVDFLKSGKVQRLIERYGYEMVRQ
jgi:molybdate transport system substrate-binding protein